MRKPLYHLLYTNALGVGGSGYRHLSVGFPEDNESTPIQLWLETLQHMAPGASEGWAFNCFGVGRSLFPVLAVVNPSFSPEKSDRDQPVLVHAFVLAFCEGETVGSFGPALYEEAKRFFDDGRNHSQVTLDSYMDGCRARGELDVQESDPKELRHLSIRFLRAFFAAASQPVKTAPFPGIATLKGLPEQILWASTALPPRLRLHVRWRVGLQPGIRGFVAMPGESDATGSTSSGDALSDWLRLALREQRFEAVRQLSEDWDIRDWNGLVKAIRAPEDRPAIAAVASAPGISRVSEVAAEREMAKKAMKPSSARRPAASRPGKSASDYGEEYQSLQKDLREYLDHRLIMIRDGVESLMSAPPLGKSPLHGPWAVRLKTWRPEIYFLVLLVLWGLHLFFSPPEREGVSAASWKQGVSKEESSLAPEPRTSADPLEEWGSFVNENRNMVAWFRALADRRGVHDRQVSPSVAVKFESWARQLEQGRELANEDLRASVIGLFEYVHARWAREAGRDKPAQDLVTLRPEEAQRNLPAFIADLGLSDAFGPLPVATDPEVQVRVILAWLERHPRP